MASRTRKMFSKALGRSREVVERVRQRVSGPPSPYRPGDQVRVSFGASGGGDVEYGTSLLAAARTHDVDLDHFCGGNSSCGTCRVRIRSGAEHLSEMHMNEEIVLGVDAVRSGDRLACQARALGPVEAEIPEFFLVR
ncbi:MAG: (2Fe-2S)-binding protein [Alphaproteobacteria bacterium]|nr:(2Fe-2S)-binding protein [Alphaproteobacteria bacterium]